MKTNIILFIALLGFAFNSCKDETTTPKPVVPVYVFPYAGDWTGTYAGDDQGTVSIAIDSIGNLAGSAYSENVMTTFTLSGTVDSSGNLTAASASTGATFAGKLTPTTGSGTWVNNTISGTWSATKK